MREVEQPPMMPGGMMTNRAPLPAPQGEPPLSEEELAAFASLATPNPDRMAQRQREVEAALRAAADLPEDTAEPVTNSESDGEECRAADPEHCRVHGEAEDDDREPWEKRQEEREHLEELMAELDWQEEAARDAEASGDPAHYNEEAARDRWSALSREGDPQTREDIEKRLAELDAEDAAENDVVETLNREPSLLEKLLIKNSGPGGEDCEAKSEETCRCAPSDWKPITMPPFMKPKEAHALLLQGVKVTNPLGEEVTLNDELLHHWKREKKSDDMINDRLAALPLIKEVIKNPAEIWENANGSRTYLASVLDPYKENGKSYTVAFTKTEDNTTLETYHLESNSIGSKREGKLLYAQKRADASGT